MPAESDRAREIKDMLAGIPVEMLKTVALQLLGATRTVSMGRDRDPVKEPDNAVRLRVWETIVEQEVGAAGSRKPTEAIVPTNEQKPVPGALRKGKSP